MSAQRLTTEVYADELTVVLIDTVECFSSYLTESFVQKNLAVQEIADTELDLPEAQTSLAQAYKIVVCVSPAFFSDAEKEVLQQLSAYQTKVSVVMPVLSGCQEEVTGEIPYLSELIHAQQQLITYCNEVLPQANFVFGQDVILPPGKFSTFELCCQSIQQGFVYAPHVPIAPHTLAEFSHAAVVEMLRPQRLSVAIKGKTKFAQTFIEKILAQYESYYFCQIGLQRVAALASETVPFTVKDVALPSDDEAVTRWFSRQLPSPEMENFFKPKEAQFYSDATMNSVVITEEFTSVVLSEPTQPNFWSEPKPAVSVTTSKSESEPRYPSISEIITLQTERIIAAVQPARSPETIPVKKKVITDEFNVSSEIQRIFTHTRMEQKNERVIELAHTQQKLTQKSKKKTTLFYGGLTFVGLGILSLLLIVVFMSSTLFLKNQLLSILQSEPSEVTQQQLARLATTAKIVDTQVSLYEQVFEVPQVAEAANLVTVTGKTQQLYQPNSDHSEALKKLFATVMGTSTGDVSQLAQNVTSELLTTYEATNDIEQALQQITFPDVAASETVLTAYQNRQSTLQKQVAILQQLNPHLPALLGTSGKRTYAVIMQNNQELRPTGGFMDAIALLTFENGVLVDHQIYTSYELAKKMPGEVAAPADITKVLGSKAFELYDANWSPDFPTSAATIDWFLEKILNTKVDGVIALDLYSMRHLIQTTGPLELAEYNEVITDKNLLERLEFHSEVVLVETEKNHDYRKVLFSHLLDKIISLPPEKAGEFITSLYTSAESKSVLINLTNSEENQVWQNLGWTGSQLVPGCPGEFSSKPCFVDHFMAAEANVGINKANYYLKRASTHRVSVSPTLAEHTHVISYENTAQLEAWPKGPYKNFLRFYLPSSAQNIKLQVGDGIIGDANMTKITDKDKLVVSTLVEVPIKSQRQVTLTYSVPIPLEEAQFSYLFFQNAQPGNGPTPYQLTITPTSELRPQLIAPQATVSQDQIVFSRADDDTSLFGVEFTQAK